jgi:hypothetical protein
MKKPLRSLILIVLAIVIVGAGAYAFFAKKALSPTDDQVQVPADSESYSDTEHGISFSYPEGYVKTEQEVGNGEREHYLIMLVRKGDEIAPEGGEGPIAITIDIYDNSVDKLSVMDWMKNTNQSNFKLGPGTYDTEQVGGEAAYTYTWSGLYEGRTTVLAHGTDIVAISVTYMDPNDDILIAYDDVVSSIHFDN